jgi:hypothetical protein
MYEQIIPWVGLMLALVLVLCLPFAEVRKLVLEIYTWALRLALLALLGAAAYLWFRPESLPVAVTDTVDNFPLLTSFLPEPGTRSFGISAAALVVAVFLPLLAILEVSRKLAGRHLRRPRVLSAGPGVEQPLRPAHLPLRGLSPAQRRIDRRAAADTLAEAGSRKPSRAVNRLEQ